MTVIAMLTIRLSVVSSGTDGEAAGEGVGKIVAVTRGVGVAGVEVGAAVGA